MGRRRKKESLFEALMVLPWWIGVGMGVATFVALRWIFPPMAPPLLKSLVPAMQTFSWFTLALFGIPGLISLARTKTKPTADVAANVHGTKAKAFSRPAGHVNSGAPSLPATPASSDPTQRPFHEPSTAQEAQPKMPDSWTVEALRELEWKRFELLCAKYYEAIGFKSETLRCGADGGIDVKLYRLDPTQPLAIVQCKAWNNAVGVKEVRELLGVMAHEKVTRGIFITTSSYTKDALSFGVASPILLLDGPAFIKKIFELPRERQDDLLKFAFEGDYATPTCASCGIKMVKRESKRGAFWGCARYPMCRNKIHIKGKGPVETA